jgi:hypothetical protein
MARSPWSWQKNNNPGDEKVNESGWSVEGGSRRLARKPEAGDTGDVMRQDGVPVPVCCMGPMATGGPLLPLKYRLIIHSVHSIQRRAAS